MKGRPPKELDQSTYTNQVAARIRERRVKKKLTVAAAAGKAGVPTATWYQWERAYALPLDRLPAIAAALGCHPRKLLPE
jgi:transcriptional regulator with XRE-family HTH domain